MDRNRIKRRRRRRWMGYMAFLVLVLTGAAVLCLAMFFRTKAVTVTGNQRYTDEELIIPGTDASEIMDSPTVDMD